MSVALGCFPEQYKASTWFLLYIIMQFPVQITILILMYTTQQNKVSNNIIINNGDFVTLCAWREYSLVNEQQNLINLFTIGVVE